MIKHILFFLMLITASVANAQSQYSGVIRYTSSSGLSMLLNGPNTELLMCEGGCTRYRVTNFKETPAGFSFKIQQLNLQYRAKFLNNTLVVTDNYNRNHQWVLYPCNRKPAEVSCPNHGGYKLVL